MNDLLKWALILGSGYLAYDWYQNSQLGVKYLGRGTTPPTTGGGTPVVPNPKTLTVTPPSTAGIPFFSPGALDPFMFNKGMSGSYMRRGTPMRSR